MTTHTHIGYKAHTGYVHCGARLWGHTTPKAGKRHALNGGPIVFTSLCGERIEADVHDEFGFRRENGPRNIICADATEARSVTCKRCLRLVRSKQ